MSACMSHCFTQKISFFILKSISNAYFQLKKKDKNEIDTVADFSLCLLVAQLYTNHNSNFT